MAGYTLGPLLQEQATAAGLEIAMNEATAVRRDGDLLRIDTDGGSHTTRTLIVASGSRFTTLGVPGEAEFLGSGLFALRARATARFFMEQAGDRGGRRRRGGGRGNPSHPVRVELPARRPLGEAAVRELLGGREHAAGPRRCSAAPPPRPAPLTIT